MRKQALIVEDNLIVRMQIADVLADLNMKVTEAGSGEEALALLSDGTAINYLVTDVGIPGSMDGLTLAKTVRQQRPDTGIVIATGRDLQIADVPYGAVLIKKPFGTRSLEAALDQVEQRQRNSRSF